MEKTRTPYLQLISQVKEWGSSLGLSNEMYTHENEGEVVWFIAHAEDSLGKGCFVHYYGTDKTLALTEKERLTSFGLETYLFSTDGVSGTDVGVLQSMYRLSQVGLIYTVLHESIHELLESKFFESAELQSGYSERAVVGQIEESLAVFLGFTLSRMYISEYLPSLLTNLEEYVLVSFKYYRAIKELIQQRSLAEDEALAQETINNLYSHRMSLEYENAPTVSKLTDFNGAYLGIMKHYSWILEDIQSYFGESGVALLDFLIKPKKYRQEIFSIASHANR